MSDGAVCGVRGCDARSAASSEQQSGTETKHLNRLLKEQALDIIYIAGPGYGRPGLVANTYLSSVFL